MIHRIILGGLVLTGLVQPAAAMDLKARLDLEPLIVKHAKANNVPAGLVHRIIIRESRYNARAVGRGGALGLMQIKHGTARALGYSGAPDGLLDADTNLTYGVRYLAGAYRVADGDQNRAVGFYARGYYYDAKRRGMLAGMAKAPAVTDEPAAIVAAPEPAQQQSLFSVLFSTPRPPEPAQPAVQTAAEEPEAPLPPPRSKRPAKRQAAVDPAARGATASAQPAQAVQVQAAQVQATKAPGEARSGAARDNRSGPRNSTASVEPRPAASTNTTSLQETAPATAQGQAALSGRPAKRTTASGADRSAQKASAQPDDPGRNP